MRVAILTFDGFNELDSFIASAMINRAKSSGIQAFIAGSRETITSMNGIALKAQADLALASEADAVLFGSGTKTREIASDPAVLDRIKLDPTRQIIGAQCSGTLLLARLKLIQGVPACTDTRTKPWVREAGVEVVEQPFIAHGNVATAGGCMSSYYLAGWVIARLAGRSAAEEVLHYVAPVGEKELWVERARAVLGAQLDGKTRTHAGSAREERSERQVRA